ncbi:hypothetical protein F2Q69_00024329 [Brassica cretica]|uniref:Uncharacterized protein n=1 Tax=Brassica cretica TaxID=69181 RepID=A0A8S9Q3I8_BRACR|nr:hypothetical protein F2Q69_00024329 [Brassica cretica]
MDYPVHTLDVRSGVPVAVFFAFSLRSTMIGSFLQQSRSDRLLDLIPVKPSLQIAQVSLSFEYFGSDQTLGEMVHSQPLGRLSICAPSARNRFQLLGTFPTRARLSQTSPALHLIQPTTRNHPKLVQPAQPPNTLTS